MLNWIFLLLIVSATVVAALTGTMAEVTQSTVDSAKAAVNLAIGLIGQMALWLGIMRVLEEAGFMRIISRVLSPIMTRLFPDVPAEHPAMASMIMNMAANMMGLTNAATPFGLKAMVELNKLNTKPGVATNAMALFLAINTSGVAVLPLGVVAVRGAMGAADVTGFMLPSILSTMCSTIVGVFVAKMLERLGVFRFDRQEESDESGIDMSAQVKGLDTAEAIAAKEKPPITWRTNVSLIIVAVIIGALVHELRAGHSLVELARIAKGILSSWILPCIMLVILLIGFSRGVRVYESVITGAKEGFNICVMIIPFLVAILVAIGMFRASGCMDFMVKVIAPVVGVIGFPPEALPMAIIRPLSGSGALGVLMETMKANGPDSFTGFLVSVMSGSTETTFYVLAVYFGSVGVRATRHTVIACLAADFTGMMMALVFARIFF